MSRRLLYSGLVLVSLVVLVWSQGGPVVSHPASEIQPGAFPDGDYSFSGNVGIGTSNPSEKLDIEASLGAVGLEINSSFAEAVLFIDSASADDAKIHLREAGLSEFTIMHDGSASRFQIRDGGTTGTEVFSIEDGASANSLYINSLGTVGIGTTAPEVKLDVVGTHVSGTGMARFKGDAGNGFITLDTTSNGESGFLNKVAGTLIGQFGARSSDNAVYIKNRIYGTGDVVTISSTGNVGIGTTTPDKALSLFGNGVVAIFGQDMTAGNNAGIVIGQEDASDKSGNIFYNINNNYLALQIAGDDIGSSLVIANGGNVGIGTTTPSENLDVASSDETEVRSYATGVNSNANLALQNDARKWIIKVAGDTSDNLQIRDVTAGAERLSIDSSGNVGIGTTSPGGRLHVSGGDVVVDGGDFRDKDFPSTNQNNGVCIKLPEGSLGYCSSSIVYKEGVIPLGLGLEAVEQLRPVEFRWVSSGERDLGFIAEEVAVVDPMLVTHVNGSVEGVKYRQLTALLVKAVKQLSSENEALRKLVCSDHPKADLCKQ